VCFSREYEWFTDKIGGQTPGIQGCERKKTPDHGSCLSNFLKSKSQNALTPSFYQTFNISLSVDWIWRT
jgi:hypothetical protein